MEIDLEAWLEANTYSRDSAPKDCYFVKESAVRELVQAIEAAAIKRCANEVPTNWVDSLLTGKDGIGKPPYNCRHIESLLRGIQDRIRALSPPSPQANSQDGAVCETCKGSGSVVTAVWGRDGSETTFRKEKCDCANQQAVVQEDEWFCDYCGKGLPDSAPDFRFNSDHAFCSEKCCDDYQAQL